MRRRVALGAVAVALVFATAACGSESSDGSSSSSGSKTTTTAAVGDTEPGTTSTDGPTECAEVGDIPAGAIDGKPTTVDLPSEPTTGDVETTVLTEGDGPEVTNSSYVTVHYLGVSCTSGQQFDSSWDTGQPITIAMPSAPPTSTAFSVIDGWNQGLLGQQQGATVQLDIPSELAYGAQGSPPAIAPNDPLTFVIEILEVSETAPAG